MMDKYKKDYDYYDSPEYAEKREKFKSIVGEAPLPPVLSGKIPAKDLRQTLKPGDKLLRKQATYGYAGGSSGNTPTGWKYSDGGEVVKAAIKNVSTKINYGMGDRMFDNSVPMRDVTHVIRDCKRYKVDDSDSSPNDLGIPESVKPKAKKRVKKNDFNSHLNITEFGSNNLRRRKSKLANFAKPGCCCDASKPLKRRKTKQTPRLKRRGNKYA